MTNAFNPSPPFPKILHLLTAVLIFLFMVSNSFNQSAAQASGGLLKQSWFHESFLDLKEDLAEAAAKGKGLIIAFEQAGCPYCREMHRVNLKDPETVAYIKKHFVFVQLDLKGSREVTDFDGKAMEERQLAKRWGIIFTPTLLFYTASTKIRPGTTGPQMAAAKMPGYFKPFHFRTMFEFVAEGHYEKKHFQNFVNERAQKLRKQGKKVKIW